MLAQQVPSKQDGYPPTSTTPQHRSDILSMVFDDDGDDVVHVAKGGAHMGIGWGEEGGTDLAGTTVTDEDELESRGLGSHCV